LMRISERFAQLFDPWFDLIHFEKALLLARFQSGQSRAIDIFHRNTGVPLVSYEVIDLNDVMMPQFLTLFRLALKIGNRRLVKSDQFGQKLQRDIALELFIERAPDDSHSAAPKNLFQ